MSRAALHVPVEAVYTQNNHSLALARQHFTAARLRSRFRMFLSKSKHGNGLSNEVPL